MRAASTSLIIDTHSHTRRGFIKRWFDDASSVKKQQLKQLVAAGQIEFILGTRMSL